MTPAVSVVMPVWNERASIRRVVEDLAREVPPVAGPTEIVVVDDASTDGTADVLAELAEQVDGLDVHRLERNRGHGGAVRAGLERARGDWIFQLDSDGQFVVAEFARLWERREDADLVLGVRAHRRDPAHRLVLSRAVRLTVAGLTRRRVRDPNVPFRLFRRALWEDLSPLLGSDVLAPSILTVVGALQRGWRVSEVEVTHLPSERGGSTLQSWRLVKFSARGLAQLVRFRVALARARSREPE
jgi:glycosyltransferase involved in cell wall biosynthesis